MKNEIITVDDLFAMEACEDSIYWMLRTYPNGAQITAETLATVPDKRWLVWLASQKYPDLRFTWAGMVFRHGSRHYPAFVEYADKVTANNYLQAKEAARAVIDEARANGANDADSYLANYAFRAAESCAGTTGVSGISYFAANTASHLAVYGAETAIAYRQAYAIAYAAARAAAAAGFEAEAQTYETSSDEYSEMAFAAAYTAACVVTCHKEIDLLDQAAAHAAAYVAACVAVEALDNDAEPETETETETDVDNEVDDEADQVAAKAYAATIARHAAFTVARRSLCAAEDDIRAEAAEAVWTEMANISIQSLLSSK